MKLKLLAAACACAISMFSWTASAEDGVTADKITFGQAAALEGPTAGLGKGVQLGLKAAFEEANKAGGVKGHKLELISLNDGYEPDQSIEATKKLLNDSKVFSLIGAIGTPTSVAVMPVITQAKVPFIGAYTGAEGLRDPYNPYVINIRASYYEETESMVEHLTKDLGIKKIAILYQNDAFGNAGLTGVKKALAKRSMELASEGTYERNTVAVKGALLSIQKGAPEAVITIAPYKPAAEFIKLAKKSGLNNAVFVNISFVGSDLLAKELGADGAGVYVTQVVPLPTDSSNPLVAKYQAALKAVDPAAEPGFISLEGYIDGRFAVAALQKANELTRTNLLSTISNNEFDLDGFKLKYSPTSNRGSDQIFLTVIDDKGAFKKVDKMTK